jgi:hypothetical protein
MQAILSVFKGCFFFEGSIGSEQPAAFSCATVFHGWNSATRFFIGNNRQTINTL